MDSYYKYLKYKTKYLQYKNIVGGSEKRPRGEVEVKEVKKQQKVEPDEVEPDEVELVCNMLDSYMIEIPGCIWYAILPPELLQKVLLQAEHDEEGNYSIKPENYKEYFDFLEEQFPFIKDKEKQMDIRIIETNYADAENNDSSILWHIESEKFISDDKISCYNIICYLKITNNTKKCGTEIFVENPDEIGRGKKYCLPAMDGLVIIMDDNKLLHKSPIIELQDKTKSGYRALLRTLVLYNTEDALEKQRLEILAEQQNKIRLIECLESLQNLDEAKKLDCLTLIHQNFCRLSSEEQRQIFSRVPGLEDTLRGYLHEDEFYNC
jgi:hypothetical protein